MIGAVWWESLRMEGSQSCWGSRVWHHWGSVVWSEGWVIHTLLCSLERRFSFLNVFGWGRGCAVRPAVEGQYWEIPLVSFVPETVSLYVRRLITPQKGNDREFGVLHLHLQPLEPDCRGDWDRKGEVFERGGAASYFSERAVGSLTFVGVKPYCAVFPFYHMDEA